MMILFVSEQWHSDCAEASEAVTGADVLTVVTLSFLEAALGRKHSLQVSQLESLIHFLADHTEPVMHGPAIGLWVA